MQYIETHCGDAIDVSALASLASISPFHFHRVFSSHVGEPVLAYIRRLRLEKAAWRLLFLDSSVTDVSTLVGYSSSAAFTRAFRAHFGTTPRKFVRGILDGRGATDEPALLPAGPEYRRIPAMQVIGVKRLGAYDRAPWEAWAALRGYLGTHPAIRAGTRIGIPLDWPELTPVHRRRYEACVAGELAPEGQFFRKQVGGGSYAVFTHHGPYQGLQASHEAIYRHWVPRTGITLRAGPAFHIYLDEENGHGDPARLRTEICVPVEAPQTVWAEARELPTTLAEGRQAECL